MHLRSSHPSISNSTLGLISFRSSSDPLPFAGREESLAIHLILSAR